MITHLYFLFFFNVLRTNFNTFRNSFLTCNSFILVPHFINLCSLTLSRSGCHFLLTIDVLRYSSYFFPFMLTCKDIHYIISVFLTKLTCSYLNHCPGRSPSFIMTPKSPLLTHLTHNLFELLSFALKFRFACPLRSFFCLLLYIYPYDSFDTTTVKLSTHCDVD